MFPFQCMRTLQRLDNLGQLSPRRGLVQKRPRNSSFNCSEVFKRSPCSLVSATNLSFAPELGADRYFNDSIDSFLNDESIAAISGGASTEI